ncbi:Hemicentin-1 [Mactra antiquata]
MEVTLKFVCFWLLLCLNPADSRDKNIPAGAASLAFVFDITGSMYDDLVQVIEGAAKILATTLSRREKPLYNYVLVPFHDPDVGPVVVTTDPDDFQHELRNLYVQGGGDCPEMSITAIKEAINVSLPNSFIYVFTDARSKDFNLTEEVLSMIQRKQSQVVFVLTGDCSNATHEGYLAYEKIASTSSGQVFLLKKNEVNEVLNFVRVAVQTRKVNLLAVDVPSSQSSSFRLPVDSKLREITISVSGIKPSISLVDPSGNLLSNKRKLKKLLDIDNALIVNVKNPQHGVWKLDVDSRAKHTIRVTGLSTTDFVVGFSRKPVYNMKDTEHRPVEGIFTHLLINASELLPPAGFSQLELVDLFGNSLGEYPLIRDTLNPLLYTTTSIMPPDGFFYVRLSGIDDKGFNIVRQTPTAITPIKPGLPILRIPSEFKGYFGLTAVLKCDVESLVPFTVRWLKQGIQQGPELYFEESGSATLDIPGANQFAEGNYYCNATNSAGNRSVVTYLDITEPPPSITVPLNVSVLPGEDAYLTCNVFSAVEYQITWHAEGYDGKLRNSQKFFQFPNDTLLVRNVQLEDEGKYICRATNEGGKSQKSMFIRVKLPPKAAVIPEFSTFVIGETIELTCEAKGYPEPSIRWLRSGQRMVSNDNVLVSGRKLTLINMQRGQEGDYECRASNEAGQHTAVASLAYIEKPYITSSDGEVLVASGDEALLTCVAEGIPPPKIHWYKGDVELKTLAYVNINEAGQLRIIGTQQFDAGAYKCEAVNEAGTDSAIVYLEVGSEATIVQPPDNVGEDIGKNATLVCQADGSPSPRVFWRRADGKHLDFGGRVQQYVGYLFIQDLEVEDEGMYICAVQNQFGTSEASAYLTITGIVAPLLGYMDPIIDVVQGETIELNCQALLGNPTPKVQWLRRGQPIPSDDYIINDYEGTLTIVDIQDFHSDDYLCSAVNVGGNASFITQLRVQVPPSFNESIENQMIDFEIIEGDGVILPCEVDGNPVPDIAWFKDDSPISLTDYHYFIDEDGSLEIYSAEAADTGSYRCIATNVAGEIEKIVNLFVQVPPTISGDPNEEYVVTENETIVLPCVANGIPPPEVTWRKNFVPFTPESSRYLFGNYGMTVSDVKIEDKAIYECVATNVGGEASKVVVLVVQIPPVIAEGGPTDIKVLKNEQVYLGCDHYGDPTPTVEWKKDEVPMSVFDDANGFSQTLDGSLFIDSAKVEQSGRYVCVVSNEAGIDTRDYSLTVQDPPGLPENLTTYTDVLEDNPIILQCPASGTPTPLITWYKNDVLITGDLIGLAILEDGSLQILATKADDSAKYKCVAENQVGRIDHEVDVKVLVPPRLVGPDQGRDGVIDNPNVIESENITLICPVEADPEPFIVWLRNEAELQVDQEPRLQISDDGKQLTIFNADVSDKARYTCIAENVAGDTQKSFDLDIYVPPSIDQDRASPEDVIVMKDNSLYLDCPVTGIPRPNVIWYKDNEILSPDLDPNLRLLAEGRRLEVIDARVSDAGRFKCVGENKAGTTEREFSVDVHVPPKIDKPGEVNKPEIIANNTISLTCPVSGIPLPNITWFKNKQPIKTNTSQYILQNDGWTLVILAAQVEDTARFVCQAINVAGDGEKAFDLNVLVPPRISTEGVNLNPKVTLNQSIVINCQVEGKPSPVITWYKNGIQLDASKHPRYEILSTGRQLRVKNAQLSDTAIYQCSAENKAGTDSIDFNLNVQVPAKIDLRRLNVKPTVVINTNITVFCPASGLPLPRITWYKNGVELVLSDEDNISIDNKGLELTIYKAQVADSGLYTCEAVNDAGTSDVSYEVNVIVPPSISDLEIDPNPSVILDNTVVLHCPADGIPLPDLVWLKSGQLLDYDNIRRITLQDDGVKLSIERAQLSDAGLYTCQASNLAGTAEQDYLLDVWVKPFIDKTGLDLNITVIKGRTAVLFCPVDANPPPEIRWYKAHNIPGQERELQAVQLDNRVQMIKGGEQLKILNSTESDTGGYVCSATNRAGTDTLDINLEVHVPPSIDESNVVYFRKVIENRTIIIECPVSGIPTPTVNWLINGQSLRLREGLQFTHNTYHLELDSAQVSDSAIYSCVASNAAGTLRKNFNLEVQVPPRVDTTGLETELGVIQNQSIVIYCPVKAIPEPSVIWFKDQVPLFDWPYPRYSLSNNGKNFEITNAQPEDVGTYLCQATNPAGQVKQEFNMSVYEPPEISGSQFVQEVSVTEGSSVMLECIASGTPTPQLAWIKDGITIEIAETPHLRIQKDGRLLQITSSQVKDGGRYVCHAENRAGISERMFDLTVNVPASIDLPYTEKNVWVIMNEPLRLECPVSGSPQPFIQWQRQGQFISQYGSPGVRLLDNGQTLYVPTSQLLDLGEYICFVENVAGNNTLKYFVNIYVPPTIDEGPTLEQAVVNTGATLLCESLGLPDPVVTWTKDGKDFPTTGLQHRMRLSGTLEFTSVRLEDAGVYRCLATNDAGNASREIKLDVQVPPRMIGRQPLFLFAREGEGIVLPCEVKGSPAPTIVWRKETTVVTGKPGVEIISNGSLYLQQPQKSDAGIYVCIARNSAGTAIGQIRLRVHFPPKIRVRSTEFIIREGGSIVFPCRAIGRPRPKITWEKDGVSVTRSHSSYRLSREGDLAVPFARKDDKGTYSCIATNRAGSSRVDMQLHVQVPPVIKEASRLLTYKVSDRAEIGCSAAGVPPPTIEWLKDGRKLDTSSLKYHVTDDGTLYINQLTEDDTGSYLCSAFNVAGQATQERLLRIQVPPSFIVVPRITEVVLNSRLELQCTADGIPTPTIHWKRNDVAIESPPSVNGRSILIIRNVRAEDAGQYTCIAQNPASSVSVNTMVVVKVPPEILAPPGNKAVIIAEKAVLTCSVGGDPQPEIMWLKNGRPVQLSDRIQQLSNGSLVIYQSTSSDAGSYKCVATNDAGISEGVAMLTIREPPSFLIEPTHTRVNEGDSIMVDCVGSGEPVPEMSWMVGWSTLEDSGRLYVLPNNTLSIVAAQLEDTGVYRCLASNNLGKSFIEINITVIVHGEWSAWTSWESCSITCGEGRQLRRRSCDNPAPANHGRDCVGPASESRSCIEKQCPVDGLWGNWMSWERCSVTCDKGVRTRQRACDSPAPQLGGEQCEGEDTQSTDCDMGPCSVDGNWGSWSDWQACSLTCGEGYQERYRSCDSPPPSNRGRFCNGPEADRKKCLLRKCPVDGLWGGWGHWTPCTTSCEGGTRSRARLCNNPEPQFGGLFCMGTDSQIDYCNNEPCPVHGGWSNWSDFGECSVSCNGGLRRRFRTCSQPAPSNNGRGCMGPSDDTETCQQIPCPVDGLWTDWSRWEKCSQTCGQGVKQRTRRCKHPRHGGIACRGDNKQVMECQLKPCYDIPIIAEGNLVGYMNNIDIPAGSFIAHMIPSEDKSVTHVNATITDVPSLLVPHFRHLISVLSPVYWTTAAEVDGTYNGYSLTDGYFAREVHIQYATGEILKMSQYSKGVDHEGKLQLDIVVRGNVPDIKHSQIVRIIPNWEEYVQSGPSSVHSQAAHFFHVDGHMLPYAVNHSIIYDNKNKMMPYLVQRLIAENVHVNIQPDLGVIHFGLDTSIKPGEPSNQCPRGFTLNPEGPYCQDNDECAIQNPCSHYCHNSAGTFYCSCPIGFTLDTDGRNCLDIDECSSGTAGCPSDQECTNTIGSYSCHIKCNRGYRPSDDGQRCIDINECDDAPNRCEQICVNKYGGYRCKCMPGYRRISRGRCIDINECELRNPPCEQVCANAHGSYLCSCRQGFELISRGRCKDINECELDGYQCKPGQECINSEGGYQCIAKCPKGKKMVNGRCKDIDECTTGEHRCYYNQRCVNTDPGYRCICPKGYRSAGPGTPCLDINECVEDTKICQHNCTNTIGSYECKCPPGYRLSRDKTICEDINECIENRINCGRDKMCFNTLGEFTCIDIPCPRNYQRDPITNNCVLECIDAEIACPENEPYADVIEFRTLALPSGVVAEADLLRLTAYNQLDEILHKTVFKILENDRKVPFQIRLENGIGIVYTPQPLEDSHLYKIKVQAKSYDNREINIQYQTTFLIHIAVSAYPY